MKPLGRVCARLAACRVSAAGQSISEPAERKADRMASEACPGQEGVCVKPKHTTICTRDKPMYAPPTYNDLMAVAQAGAVPREEAEQEVRHAGTPSETGPDVRQAGSEPGLNLKQLVRAIAKALRRKDACQEELSVQLQDLLR